MKLSFQLKKIDKLLISSFWPPMLLSFLIALFVLTMQFFWLYIDEIMGKGIGFFQIIELISYMTISFVPMALPLAILLASVMVFGNMGERYELSSMKSAGISLLRILKPLVILCSCIAIFSFLASNYIIPKANLKFLTRLYDIRRQKPALAIEEGVFNDDFFGYSIFVGKKHRDKKSLEDVLFYDQSLSTDRILCYRAKRGAMYTTEHNHRFVLELYDGEEIEEPAPTYSSGGRRNYPLMRTSFKTVTKSFDLEEFDINATDENRFSDNQKMLNNGQILSQIDSLKKQITISQAKVGVGISQMFDTIKRQETVADLIDGSKNKLPDTNQVLKFKEQDSLLNRDPASLGGYSMLHIDSLQASKESNDEGSLHPRRLNNRTKLPLSKIVKDSVRRKPQVADLIQKVKENSRQASALAKDTAMIDLKPDTLVSHFYDLLSPNQRSYLCKNAASNSNLRQTEIYNVLYTLDNLKKKEILFWQQFHIKIYYAVACIMFLFIGGPMGAIVRKGGFGYPLLISIIFFVIYIMASKSFEKLTDSLVMNVHLGMWFTTIIISLVGAFLTYRASKDMSSNAISNAIDKMLKLIFARFQKSIDKPV